MVYSTRLFILSLALRFLLVVSSPFSIAITSPGEERAGLCAFRAFVCFAGDSLCLFPLPLGVRDWLRVVIVALPGHFFCTFFFKYAFSNDLINMYME